MKKKNIRLKGRLVMNKEILVSLEKGQQFEIVGGAPLTAQAYDARCQTYQETCATIPYRGHICNILC